MSDKIIINKNTLIILGVALACLIGGYVYYKQQNTHSVTLAIGNQEITAKVSE